MPTISDMRYPAMIYDTSTLSLRLATTDDFGGGPSGGGLTDAELRATPVPVSGTVSVGNFPATQAVSGTFWQATQPVSGPLTDSQLRAVAVPVSGTFFQATQPVSLASLPAANPSTAYGKTLTRVAVNQGGAGTLQLAAASSGNKHKLVGAVLTMSADGTLKFTDGQGDLTGALDVAAKGGFVLPASILPYLETSIANTAISIVTTGGAARGWLYLLTEA